MIGARRPWLGSSWTISTLGSPSPLAAAAALGEHQGSPWAAALPTGQCAGAMVSAALGVRLGQVPDARWRRTLPGDGRHAAVFRARLSVPGRWRLQYHWPTWRKVTAPKIGGPAAALQALSLRRYFDKQGTYDMRVATAAHTTAVDFDGAACGRGWNTLGDFDFGRWRSAPSSSPTKRPATAWSPTRFAGCVSMRPRRVRHTFLTNGRPLA